MIMNFLIEPLEPVLYGPPVSHVAGESHRVESLFPPTPFAFQGMIRTHLLHSADPPVDLGGKEQATIRALVGRSDALPEGWQIIGPLPARRRNSQEGDGSEVVEPWVATPRFILQDDRQAVFARHIPSHSESLCDLGKDLPLFGRPDLDGCQPRQGWIGPTNLRHVLAGEFSQWKRKLPWDNNQWSEDYPPFVKPEFQPGLAIGRGDKQSTTQQGMLYFAKFLRFRAGSGFFGSLMAAQMPQRLDIETLTTGIGRSGYKGRLTAFHAVENLSQDWLAAMRGDHLPDSVTEQDTFWLFTLTPVRLKNEHVREPEIQRTALPSGVTIQIMAALTGRASPLGGYRFENDRPRDNHLYLPAGSAWLFRLQGGSNQDRRESLTALHNAHPLGNDQEAAMGFGHTLVGIVPTAPSTAIHQPATVSISKEAV